MFRSRPRLIVLSSLLALSSCGGPTVGGALRPDAAKGTEAVDGPQGPCREVGETGQPLVVDWPAHERTNVEEAMMSGVAVVAYDCKTLRLLKDCSLEGS